MVTIALFFDGTILVQGHGISSVLKGFPETYEPAVLVGYLNPSPNHTINQASNHEGRSVGILVNVSDETSLEEGLVPKCAVAWQPAPDRMHTGTCFSRVATYAPRKILVRS
jgi:hypothetical protein